LGSNLGNKKATLIQALKKLNRDPRIHLAAVSPLYETAPIGPKDQPSFLNAVAGLASDLPPGEMLTLLKKLEQESGRIKTRTWGERTLDLDILLLTETIINTRELTIPHPRILERAFVLIPLSDLNGNIIIPGPSHRTVAMAIKNCNCTGVQYHGEISSNDLL
jgi:2-amino-4-hydroxy-6-hydroxymethyldihydropteridine diphosphokinase